MIEAAWNSSETEICDAMLVASMSRMNWLASAGNIIFSDGMRTMYRNT
jgi:hypothetical protein